MKLCGFGRRKNKANSKPKKQLLEIFSKIWNFLPAPDAQYIGATTMNEKNGQFDEDLDMKVSPEFKADLSNLFKSRNLIPPEVDRAILGRASVKLIRRQRRHSIIRRIGTIAAAAAVIIFAFSLDLTKKPQPSMPSSQIAVIRSIDIDQSGRVDILDAFKLARQIELAIHVDKNFDINGDGLVNRDDVDFVALAAVSLPLQKQGPG